MPSIREIGTDGNCAGCEEAGEQVCSCDRVLAQVGYLSVGAGLFTEREIVQATSVRGDWDVNPSDVATALGHFVDMGLLEVGADGRYTVTDEGREYIPLVPPDR